MIIQISYKRMYQVVVVFVLVFLAWFTVGHFSFCQRLDSISEEEVTFTVKFLVPMLKNETLKRLSIESQLPGQKVDYDTKWLSPHTIKITISEKKYPRGLVYRYKFNKAPALILPLKISVQGKVSHKVKPELVSVFPEHNVPAGGPIMLKFNTLIDPESFIASVNWDGGCEFKPVIEQGPEGSFINYSEWKAVPQKKLQNNQIYKIQIKENLTAQNGLRMGKKKEVTFTTAPDFSLTGINPKPESESVWLGRNILLETNQLLRDAQITVKGVTGVTEVKDRTAVFIPERIYRPDTSYQVEAVLTSEYGEKLHRKFSFHTVNLGSQQWLEVKLGKACNIWVLEGKKEINKIPAWMEREPPRGTLYEKERGIASGSTKDNARCWIKLNADVLLHSLPEESSGPVEDNHRILGLPETYICLYMKESDIKRLYNTLPKGFMVIVH